MSFRTSFPLRPILTVLLAAALLTLGLFAALAAPTPALATVGPITCYVDADSPGPIYNGLSWTTAYTNVQDALASVTCSTIWVAEGVYYPDEGSGQTNNAQTSTFALKDGIEIYGGFAATETLRTQRSWTGNVTILSGDLSQDDDNIDANNIAETWNDKAGTNANTVVSSGASVLSAVLDGFTITAGGNNLGGGHGGIFNGEGSLTLANLRLSGNTGDYGGGIGSYKGAISLQDSTISGNYGYYGGGLNIDSGTVFVENVDFIQNRSYAWGSGMYLGGGSVQTTGVLTNVRFIGNQGTPDADGGGLVLSFNTNDSIIATNVLFAGNAAARWGGAVMQYGGTSTFTNITVSGNHAALIGGAFRIWGGSATIQNSIIYGNTAGTSNEFNFNGSPTVTINNSIVNGGCPAPAVCSGVTSTDPLFVAPVSAASAPTTTGNYRLQDGSPALNVGSNALNSTAFDLDGNPRIANTTIDLGAYENQSSLSTAVYLFSSDTGGTLGSITFADEDVVAWDGSTWSLLFDGSLFGFGAADLDALEVDTDGSLLLSLDIDLFILSFAKVADEDVFRFTPTVPGNYSAGTFSWFLDNSDVALTTTSEDVDALGFRDGKWLQSTDGSFVVTGVSGDDKDLFAFAPTSTGSTTAGAFTFAFDASDVLLTLTTEDIDALWSDPATGDLYLSTLGNFAVPSLSGEGRDVFVCTPTTLGLTTACTFTLFFDGSAYGFPGSVDAFAVK